MLFVRPLIKTTQSVRTGIIISGPPSVKLSTGDKLVHGFIIYASIISVPAYITCNFKRLRGAMFAKNSLFKILPKVRQMSTVSGPPSNPVPLPEKMVHGAVIAVAILAIPTWVLTHIREYRGAE